MNKTIIVTVACIVLMAVQACVGMSAKAIVPSDKNISKNETPESSFSAIELNGPINVVYRNGNSHEVRIDGPDNVVPLVETTVSGGKLAIKYKDNTRISGDADVTVYVTAPDVAGFVANGSGGISIKSAIDIPGRDAVMTVKGSGEINCYAVKTLDATINGSGEVRYGGSPQVSSHGNNSDNISRN